MPNRSRALVLTVGVALALASPGTPALAKKRPAVRCPDGLFLVQGASPIGSAGAPPTVTIRNGQISISSGCTTAVPVRLKARRAATVVTARWPSCDGLSGVVVLSAKIRSPACDTLAGQLVVKKAKPRKRKLTATRQAPAALIATLAD